MRPLVLVAYRACPAAFQADGILEYPRSCLFFQVNCHLSVILMTDDIDCLLFLCLSSTFQRTLVRAQRTPYGVRARQVESKGVEPLTPSLQSWCSSQLS